MYRIFETVKFKKSLEQDFGGQRKKIKKKLRRYVYPQIKETPGFGPNIKRLFDWEPPTWRYRIGDFRFFYEIDHTEKVIFMILADHRGKAYKK